MSDPAEDEQARIYEARADAYDALIAAEDADGALKAALTERLPWTGRRVADVGAGTGRLARWIAPRAARVHLVDRAGPMLEVARRRLEGLGVADRTDLHRADARALPLADASVDVAVAGWVFGHFRYWMPGGWRAEVDRALAEMRRVVTPGGPIAVVETLGVGHEAPHAYPGLEEYFAHLEEAHGLSRSWLRTDFAFDDVETAARTLGGFFGPELAATVRERGWRRVPECTALFL